MNQPYPQIQFWMGHADVAWLKRVTEDVMASFHMAQLPALRFKHLDQLATVYGGYYLHQQVTVNAWPEEAA